MNYAALSAKELQAEIDRAAYWANRGFSDSELRDALQEVQRLRIVCQDIVEIIATDPDSICQNGESGLQRVIYKIEDKAQEHYMPVEECV